MGAPARSDPACAGPSACGNGSAIGPAFTASVHEDHSAAHRRTGGLRIGFVSPGWPRARFANGIVSAIDVLVPAIEGLGAEVRVLPVEGEVPASDPRFLRLPEAERKAGLARVASAMRWRLWPWRAQLLHGAERVLQGLERLRHEAGIDLLEMEESFGWAGPVARRAGIPVIVCLHGPWFLHGPMAGGAPDAAFRARVRAEGEALRRADAVLAPAHDVLERTRAHYGLALPRAEVIPYSPGSAPAAERWKLWESDWDEVLFAGRFDGHKGGDLILDAFAIVLAERPRARLTFVGSDRGIVDLAGRRWSLREYAEARLPGARKAGRLRILDVQPPDALDRLHRRALVTVSCSRYENLSLAALHAMSLGCPLVVADRGGLPEHVKDGENGRLFRAGDAASLARVILELLDDPEQAERLGGAAAAYVERELHPFAVAGQRLDFYHRVLSDRADRRWA